LISAPTLHLLPHQLDLLLVLALSPQDPPVLLPSPQDPPVPLPSPQDPVQAPAVLQSQPAQVVVVLNLVVVHNLVVAHNLAVVAHNRVVVHNPAQSLVQVQVLQNHLVVDPKVPPNRPLPNRLPHLPNPLPKLLLLTQAQLPQLLPLKLRVPVLVLANLQAQANLAPVVQLQPLHLLRTQAPPELATLKAPVETPTQLVALQLVALQLVATAPVVTALVVTAPVATALVVTARVDSQVVVVAPVVVVPVAVVLVVVVALVAAALEDFKTFHVIKSDRLMFITSIKHTNKYR